MPCKVEPGISSEEYLRHMLCQCCRYLTKEQIASIKGIDVYVDLCDWYRFHLLDDAIYFEREYTKENYGKEHFRIGLGQLSILSIEEKQSRKNKELDRIKKELYKLGLELIIDGTSIGIDSYGRKRDKDT